MKTLNEYNAEAQERHTARVRALSLPQPAGVACLTCGAEMDYVKPDLVNMSSPPSQTVHCPSCKTLGYKVLA
jgi:hypothetical protein